MDVKINQVYKAPMMAGRTLRRVRILAHHPDGGYLAEILYSANQLDIESPYTRISLLALEKAYVLQHDVCDHRGPKTEVATVNKGEDDEPTSWKCSQCRET